MAMGTFSRYNWRSFRASGISLLWVLAGPVLCGTASGESGNPRTSGEFADYISYGITHNPKLQANYRNWQAALQQIPQAKALPDPVVTATNLVEDVQTRTGPQRNQVFIAQQLPWFGKLRARGNIASGEADAIHHAYEAAVLQTARDIGLAYYDYAYLGEATEIVARIVALLQRLEENVREKVRAGESFPSLLKMEIENVKAQDILQEMEKVRLAESSRLLALLGSNKVVVLPFPKLVRPAGNAPDRGTLLKALMASNPELLSLSSRIERAEDAVKLSRMNLIPDPTIGAGIFDTGEAVNPSLPGSGADPWGIRMSFNIPIWKKKNQAERLEARERHRAAQRTLVDRKNMLTGELDTAIQDHETMKKRVDFYGTKLLPKARQAMEVTESSYQVDKSTILDLIDAERTLLEIERTYWKAVSEQYKAQVRLQTLTGKRPSQ